MACCGKGKKARGMAARRSAERSILERAYAGGKAPSFPHGYAIVGLLRALGMGTGSAVVDLGPEHYEVARHVFPVARYVAFDTDLTRRRAFDVTTTRRDREAIGNAFELGLVETLDGEWDYEDADGFDFVVCSATLRASQEGMHGIMQRARQVVKATGVAVFLVALAGVKERQTIKTWKGRGKGVSRYRKARLLRMAQAHQFRASIVPTPHVLWEDGYGLLVMHPDG